jgi:formyl-CoA transferase
VKSPLEGLKILDFSIAIATPLGGAMLADMGAEVIKVERLQGEVQRLGFPAGMHDKLDTSIVDNLPDSATWMGFNRGKKDLEIDIRTEKGKEIILKLAKEADDIIQSFRPGVAERLGIGHEVVNDINPRVIYYSLSGYGKTVPVIHRAGGDMWNQAMSGIVSLLGYPGGRPSMPPFPACDHLLTDDPKFNTDEALYKIREEIGRLLDEAFSKKPGRNGSRYSAKLGCVAIHADL